MREKWRRRRLERIEWNNSIGSIRARNEHSTQSTETSLLFTRILASVFGVYRFVRSISTRESATIDTIRRKLRITPFFLFFFFFFFCNTQEEIVRDRSFRYIPSIVLAKIPSPRLDSIQLPRYDFFFFVLRSSSKLSSSVPRDHGKE